jgi:hypothetical protein
MPIDLELRTNQVWGYLTLILGCLLSIVQFFALISPWRLDLRVFLLLVVLASLPHSDWSAIHTPRP